MSVIGLGEKSKSILKAPLLNLSVEEENLAAIPFAVLERRVGKRVGKIEIGGTKTLPDGTTMRVTWQVQGNNELGLPTEQDLDVFVALGALTFRNNFAKTVTFTGREIAKILGIGTVHGKFYKRLKLAMDRFIPLRFRALTETEQREEVKWCNIFQEASFSLNHTTGRCTGSVTWTDKLHPIDGCRVFPPTGRESLHGARWNYVQTPLSVPGNCIRQNRRANHGCTPTRHRTPGNPDPAEVPVAINADPGTSF